MKSNIIMANRMERILSDVKDKVYETVAVNRLSENFLDVQSKVYTRDIFNSDS